MILTGLPVVNHYRLTMIAPEYLVEMAKDPDGMKLIIVAIVHDAHRHTYHPEDCQDQGLKIIWKSPSASIFYFLVLMSAIVLFGYKWRYSKPAQLRRNSQDRHAGDYQRRPKA